MTFTSVIRLFPEDERGIEIATLQIQKDLDAGLISPQEVDKLFHAVLDVYTRVREAREYMKTLNQ